MISGLLILFAIYVVVIISIKFINKWHFKVTGLYFLDKSDVPYIFVPFINVLLLAIGIGITLYEVFDNRFDIDIKEKIYNLFK